MTPAAVRAKIIDMLKAGTTHAAIMAKLQVGRDTVGKVAKDAGLQRARPPRNGVKRPRAYDGASDNTPYRGPKALQPWPDDPALRFDAPGRVVRIKNAACAARERAGAG